MKQRKPLSTKKPPIPATDVSVIQAWIEDTQPTCTPIVTELNKLISERLQNPCFAIKWSSAFFGDRENGWCIELAAYDKSVNVVFLNPNALIDPPELGGDTRYIKLTSIEDIAQVEPWITQACQAKGWQW